jgi:hypothetical protein
VKSLFIIATLCLPVFVTAQQVSVSGVVRDKKGDTLPLANIIILPDSSKAVADPNGKFFIKTFPGSKQFIVSYTGYQSFQESFVLHRDTTVQFDQLDEVIVRSNRYSQTDWIETTRSGSTTLTPNEINAIPVLGGESDVIKVMQLLPGTVRGVEGSSDLFVRGGAADQNLVLLDDVPIYNTSHLFGFISVFNPDVLEC